MVTGGLVAIVLTLFMEFTGTGRRRIELGLESAALPELDRFLLAVASRLRWSAASTERLRAAGEELLLCLVQADEIEAAGGGAGRDRGDGARRLRVVARNDQGSAELEFIAAAAEGNLEDRMVLLRDGGADGPNERELSLRLLRHYAASVQHRQYHDIDVVTVRVDAVRSQHAMGANREQ